MQHELRWMTKWRLLYSSSQLIYEYRYQPEPEDYTSTIKCDNDYGTCVARVKMIEIIFFLGL